MRHLIYESFKNDVEDIQGKSCYDKVIYLKKEG